MWRTKVAVFVVVLVMIGAMSAPVVAAPRSGALVAQPETIDFKSKRVGTENYKKTRITNTTSSDVRLVVTGGLPDDFGFGLLPGSTCPVFSPGEILPAGASCYAVVRFSPTAGFVGWTATGSLIATATDPVSGALIQELSIPVIGTAVLSSPSASGGRPRAHSAQMA